MSTPTTPGSRLSTGSGIFLVAEREIGSKLRSKAFLISTGILLLIALAGVLIGGFMSKTTSDTKVAVTSETAQAVQGLPTQKMPERLRPQPPAALQQMRYRPQLVCCHHHPLARARSH